MSKNAGLVLAGLAIAGIGAYLVLNPPKGLGVHGKTWAKGDFVLVTGYTRFPGGVNGVIDNVNSDGTYRIRITIWDDAIGASVYDFITAQPGMLS